MDCRYNIYVVALSRSGCVMCARSTAPPSGHVVRFPQTTGDAAPNGYYHDAMFIAHPMVSAAAPPTDEGVGTCTW